MAILEHGAILTTGDDHDHEGDRIGQTFRLMIMNRSDFSIDDHGKEAPKNPPVGD